MGLKHLKKIKRSQKPRLIKLEQRFVFDGAAALDVVKTITDLVTPNAALSHDTTNNTNAAYANDSITNTGELTQPTNIGSGNQVEYRITKDGVLGDWTNSYSAPLNDGSQDGKYQVALSASQYLLCT